MNPASRLYDHGAKRQYRRDIWAQFKRWCHVPRAQARCLLMPGPSNDEIEVALAAGFREQNLVLVDRNPALVASRKRYYPRARAYGVPLERAAERMAGEGIRLDCATLDLMGCVGRNLETAIAGLVRQRVLADRAVLAITFLRGRERHTALPEMFHVTADGGEDQASNDERRICWIEDVIQEAVWDLSLDRPLWGCYPRRFFSYRSAAGSQTMGVYVTCVHPTTPETGRADYSIVGCQRADFRCV